ncbi:hypothetical protein FHX74_000212 [Friedmanniella endophytica]|uniref:Amine oxidase domain-containing protein n=1 Tax=Microlunatus kandeliicorticis TaxID=1759536 RepID=A0A7W3IP23_9ACTN|nr:FAD-dependent oxidoreductase [Microlunatus kandeliicorticis]MBA8792618.1 hypothetical protein [Microlunatus kandeliicorticis]
MSVIVVGAGIAGVSCARTLAAAGVPVRVLDRGRRPGGRLGLRRLTVDGGERVVDTGGSYFTVSDDGFGAVAEDWRARGLARPWTDTFAVIDDDGEQTKQGPTRWAAPSGLRSLVDDLAAGLDVSSSVTVTAVEHGDDGWTVRTETRTDDGRSTGDAGPADVVVLAMPDPQARRLLADGPEREAFGLEFEPVLALTAAWPERSWPDRDGVFVNGDDVLAWVADDGLRRGDRAPVLVAHSTPDFARPRLEDPAAAAGPMAERLVDRLGLAGPPASTHVQRWSFARPATPRDEPYLLTPSGLAACGDGWAAKPSVEAAFVSGRRLAEAALARG